jgi:serine/threonine protein kinase
MSDAPRARNYEPDQIVPGTKYKVMRLIGAGGMGTVYDVEDTSIGKRYVLKTLHPQLGSREDLARRMQQEARTLARLGHPNIVEVITAGVTEDDLRLPYFVMERLEGQSLRIVLEKKGQLELAHAYHIAIDLLEALDFAHDKGVIHRDVKPDNIFLHRTTTGVTVTKLLDFGIVSLLHETNRETAGRFLGTLRYAAPEQLTGKKPTPKTDIYAAAIVLYEMVAGRGPFDEYGDSARIAAAHLNVPAPALSQFVIIPRELDNLVRAALAKDPDKRPRDAFSFATSLKNLKKALAPRTPQPLGNASTAPVSTSPPSSSPQMRTVRVSDGPVTAPHGGIPQETPTTPDAVDRSAPTNTGVVDTPRMAQHGTEGYAPAPHVRTLPAADAFQWPAESPPAKSEEPQVRSLQAHSPSERRNVVTAVFTVVALLALSGTLVAMLLARRPRHMGAREVPASAAVSVPAPSVVPAATEAAPLSSDTASAPPETTAPSTATSTPVATATPIATATQTPVATSNPKPRPTPIPTTKPIATSKPAPTSTGPDRPGPGF